MSRVESSKKLLDNLTSVLLGDISLIKNLSLKEDFNWFLKKLYTG